MTNDDKKCKECGKSQVYAREMCRKCYEKFRRSLNFVAKYQKPSEYIGKKYGLLTVAEILHTKNGKRVVKATCECGKTITTTLTELKAGKTTNCGCAKKERCSRLHTINEGFFNGTRIQNLGNKPQLNNTSGIRGVWFDKRTNMWAAEIKFQGKKMFLGRYKDKNKAIKARKNAEDEYFKPIKEEFEQYMAEEDEVNNVT